MTLSINSASMGMMTSLQNQASTAASKQTSETEQSKPAAPPPGGPPPNGAPPSGSPPSGPPPGGKKETSNADLASVFEILVSNETDEDSDDDTSSQSAENAAEAGYSTVLNLLSA